MVSTGGASEAFVLAVEDPYLDALIGTIEEPQGSATAQLAGRLTAEWWETHGAGPSCTELLNAVFIRTDWDHLIEDPSQTILQQRAHGQLLQQWLISYWVRLGAIALVPGHDEVFKPGAA